MCFTSVELCYGVLWFIVCNSIDGLTQLCYVIMCHYVLCQV